MRCRLLHCAPILMVALVACSPSPDDSPPPSPAPTAVPSTTPPASAVSPEAAGQVAEPPAIPAPTTASSRKALRPEIAPGALRGDLPEILARRTLRVLVVPNHTHFFVDGMHVRGFSAEAFELFRKRLDRELKTHKRPMNVLFVPVRRDRIIGALADGLGDVAAADLTITDLRQRHVDFTAPLYDNVSEIVVTSPNGPELARLEDLSGRTVHARPSTAYFANLNTFNTELAARGLPPVKISPLPDVLEDEDRLEMLNAGLIDIALVDSHIAGFWHTVFPRLRLYPELALDPGGRIAWAVRRDAPQLRAALDEFITTEFRRGTAERNLVHAKYLRNITFVTNATGGAAMARFRALAPLFQRYGERYDVDWQLMAAQGFQESRLDQRVVSPVGAIGVMQVMPATGQELRVGDIREVDPNVHAGIKYMSRLTETHFDDPKVAPVDRMLFALAGYNAGPSRIHHLREEAARSGFDPNIWFDNVEVVAARRIGREPVQYVRNIYKYYIAYVLATQEHEARGQVRSAPTP